MHGQLLLVTKIMVTLSGIHYPDILWHLHVSERKEQLPKANSSLLAPCGQINKERDMACTVRKGQHYIWLLVGAFSQIPPLGHLAAAHSYSRYWWFLCQVCLCPCCRDTTEEPGRSGGFLVVGSQFSLLKSKNYYTVRAGQINCLLIPYKELIVLWISSNP